MRFFLAVLLALATILPANAHRHSTFSYHTHSYGTHYRSYHRTRIHRSSEARHEFERMTGYPHGRPGYIIDHVVPLACGGADAPSNMQWQTIADAKAKDKWERKDCK